MPTIQSLSTVLTEHPNGIEALIKSSNVIFRFLIVFLEENLIRVSIGQETTEETKTWIVVNETGDVPWDGKIKTDYSRFTCPKVKISKDSNLVLLTTSKLQIKVYLQSNLRIECYRNLEDIPFYSDASFDAYQYDVSGGCFRHTIKRLINEDYFGFGECSGKLSKKFQRLRVDAKDSMGYDAEYSDPLYKHWPYHMTIIDNNYNKTSSMCYGLLYDTLRRSTFDLGKEISAFRGDYRYFETEKWEKGLDYYLFSGENPAEISRTLIQLIGPSILPPNWALGYLGSSMAYTESENAMQRLEGYLEMIKRHEIPCDGYHLSSGYTTDSSNRRCVFTWNYNRIPQPVKMFETFNSQKISVIANVKPWLLVEHPEFERVNKMGGFFTSSSGGPSYGRFWVGDAGTSGLGCYLDFTNPATREWWKSKAKSSLLELGCKALWNDNNEYEVDESTARCYLNGNTIEESGRALHTLLMAKTSQEALLEHFNGNKEDVLVVSRSGCIGTHRYASQTWSGDNSTSWKTLRYNISMCLSLGLSGWVGSGPDVGGFAGEKPSSELFWRWVQSGVFMPRFSIHSSVWKTLNSDLNQEQQQQTTNEPWMFPEKLNAIRCSIRWRYRFSVLLKSLYIEANQTGAPVVRPLLFHYFSDKKSRESNFQFMLGKDLLVSPVCEDGIKDSMVVYFPGKNEEWYDLNSKIVFSGETTQTVPIIDVERAHLSWFAGCPIFLRKGGGFVLTGDKFEGNQLVNNNERHVILALDENLTANCSWMEENGIILICSAENGQISINAYSSLTTEGKKMKPSLLFTHLTVQQFEKRDKIVLFAVEQKEVSIFE